MANDIEYEKLRQGTQADVISYLRGLQPAVPTASITKYLLENIVAERLPPATFAMWLQASTDPSVAIAAIRQSDSSIVRSIAVARLVCLLRSAKYWSATWTALDGAQGLASIMHELSINDLKTLCSGIGGIKQGGDDIKKYEQRRKAFTELFLLLTRGDTANDQRPLKEFYTLLMPACDLDVTIAFVSDGDAGESRWDSNKVEHIMRTFRPHYEQQCLKTFLGERNEEEDNKDEKPELGRWRHLFNESIDFCMKFMETILKSNRKIEIKPEDFIHQFANPLAKRLQRGAKHNVETQLRGFGLMQEILTKRPELAPGRSLSFSDKTGLLRRVTKLWRCTYGGEHEQRATEILANLIAACSAPSDAWKNDDYPELMGTLPKSMRYPFFKLACLNRAGCNFDIDLGSEADLAQRKPRPTWPARAFDIISPQDALALLKRLRKACPDDTFIVDRYQSGPDELQPDIELRQVRLEAQVLSVAAKDTEWDEKVDGLLRVRKKKAQESREWNDRAAWAKSAFSVCVASGSLRRMSEWFTWATRFNKDPLTVQELYAQYGVVTGFDTQTRLSGLANSHLASADETKTEVETANSIIMQIFENAAVAMREPSFNANNWISVRTLVGDVVRRRMRDISASQSRLGLSDEELYNAVWQPTLELLLWTESFGLRDGYESLRWRIPRGLLAKIDPKHVSHKATCRFLDELVRARDQMWREYRCRVHPEVISLGPPWPKGLPIQSLCFQFDDHNVQCTLCGIPYLQERVECVLFMDPKEALASLPKAEEVRKAIWPFADSYLSALRLYANDKNGADDDTHSQKLRKAWDYALEHLNIGDMTPAEAVDFWWWKYKDIITPVENFPAFADVVKRFKKKPPAEVVLPVIDDPKLPTEWNPAPPLAEDETREARNLPARTCLDWIICAQNRHYLTFPSDPPSKLQLQTVAKQASTESFFNAVFYSGTIIMPATADKWAALALIFIMLNTKYGSDPSLMMKPFPSAGDPRFPALYLDEEFLEKESNKFYYYTAFEKLESWVGHIPPTLLSRLAKSLYGRMKITKERHRDVTSAFMTIVTLLSKSDKPLLAVPFIRDVLLDHQDDSAWHRQLFNVRFLKSLPPPTAKQVFDGLAVDIQTRLEKVQQAAKPPTETVASNEAAPGPAVKVSTVKMIAQMLDSPKFLDQRSVCDILIKLFKTARHIDIRIAVVESLFSVFENCPDGELKAYIFDAMREHVVPVAAALEERRPMTETQWEKAESSGDLPDIGDKYNTLAMLLLGSHKLGSKWEQKYANELLVDLLRQSAANHRRWIDLFTKKNGFSLEGVAIPHIPSKSNMFNTFLHNWRQFLPRSAFNTVRESTMLKLNPPQKIRDITEAVRGDKKLKQSDEGKHWLDVFDDDDQGQGALDLGASCIALHLRDKLDNTDPDAGITVHEASEFIFEVCENLIASGEKLRLPKVQRLLYRANKSPASLALLNRVIKHVEELRTPEWEADGNRQPQLLPDLFDLAIQGVAFPTKHPASEEDIETTARGIKELMRTHLCGAEPYHERFARLKKHIVDEVTLALERRQLALALGEVGPTDKATLLDHLRVEIADDLLQASQGLKDKALVQATGTMLAGWHASKVERFRVRAEDTKAKLVKEQESNSGEHYDARWWVGEGA